MEYPSIQVTTISYSIHWSKKKKKKLRKSLKVSTIKIGQNIQSDLNKIRLKPKSIGKWKALFDQIDSLLSQTVSTGINEDKAVLDERKRNGPYIKKFSSINKMSLNNL